MCVCEMNLADRCMDGLVLDFSFNRSRLMYWQILAHLLINNYDIDMQILY